MHLAEFHFFLFSFHSSRNSIKKNVFRCINFSTFRLSGSRFPDKIAWRFPCGVTASDTPCLSKWGWFLGGWTNVSCLESCSCIFFTFASETANAETYKHFVRFELLYRGGIKFNSYAKQKFCSQFPTIGTNQQASNVCGEIIYFFPFQRKSTTTPATQSAVSMLLSFIYAHCTSLCNACTVQHSSQFCCLWFEVCIVLPQWKFKTFLLIVPDNRLVEIFGSP